MSIREYLEEQKAKCQKRLTDLEDQEKVLDEKNDKAEDEAELKAIGDEIAELQAEKAEAEAELKEIEAQLEALEDKPAEDPKPEEKPKDEVEVIVNPQRNAFLQFGNNVQVRALEKGGQKTMTIEERKARAEAFIKNGEKETISVEEVRATLVSGGSIATPTKVEGIQPIFEQVSSIVDLVRIENNRGMGSAKYSYEIANPEARDQTEGEAVTIDDTTYGYVTMTPDSVMCLRQISKQVRRQSPLDYEGKIVDSAEKALRKKAAKYITNKILASDLIVKPALLKISAIDEHTLRNIAFSYGGDDTIEGSAWLFLNKKDLIKFGDVRSDTTLQAVYEITPDSNNPNTGIIKDGGLSVRYCLNSNLSALADASSNGVAMFYGQPQCAVLGLFSDYEVQVSEDFAFDKNMLTIRGDAELGCVVDHKDGFVCVTKA